MKRIRRGKGFTLLELLIVVVILAILAGLALPQYLRTVAKARQAEGWQNMGTLRGSITRYYAEYGIINSDIGVLDIMNPNEPSNRLFDYSVEGDSNTDYDFTITAGPRLSDGCTGCSTLIIDADGGRTIEQ